jgi:hypothetical protein
MYENPYAASSVALPPHRAIRRLWGIRAWCPQAVAQTRDGHRDTSGIPFPSGEVSIATPCQSVTALLGPGGTYQVDSLIPGAYTVYSRIAFTRHVSVPVTITAGDTVRLDLIVAPLTSDDLPTYGGPDTIAWQWDTSGMRIPADLEEALTALEKMLPTEFQEYLRAQDEDHLSWFHHGLGTALRNEWGLWGGSALADCFRQHGIDHPDAMSGIILTSFWRHLRNQPIAFDEQVASSRRWSERARKPTSLVFPHCQEGVVLEFQRSKIGDSVVTHVGRCTEDGKWWGWEFDRGWFPMTCPVGPIRRAGA